MNKKCKSFPSLPGLKSIFTKRTRPSATGAWVCSVWGPITSHLGTAKNVLEAVKTNGTLLSLDCAGENARPVVQFHRNLRPPGPFLFS
jgi:hypothetical protein